jgi:hypothetical protein
VNKQRHIPPTAARGSPAAAMPRPLALARRLFVVSGVLNAAYVLLALMELDHLAAGRVLTSVDVGLAVATTLAMLPFAILVRRARPWARNVMIATCVTLITVAVVVITADAAVLPAGPVAGWFLLLHHVTAGLTLAAAIGGVAGLIGADTGAYFRRHHHVAEVDPRLWPVSRLRDLQTARVERARDTIDAVRSHQPAPRLEVASVPLGDVRTPASAAIARAA